MDDKQKIVNLEHEVNILNEKIKLLTDAISAQGQANHKIKEEIDNMKSVIVLVAKHPEKIASINADYM